jgi:hypothetical protein
MKFGRNSTTEKSAIYLYICSSSRLPAGCSIATSFPAQCVPAAFGSEKLVLPKPHRHAIPAIRLRLNAHHLAAHGHTRAKPSEDESGVSGCWSLVWFMEAGGIVLCRRVSCQPKKIVPFLVA